MSPAETPDTPPTAEGGGPAATSPGWGNTSGPLEQRIRDVGRALSQGLGQVLAGLPGAPGRPHLLVPLLGINRAVAGRVLQAAASRDPFETLHVVPGPDPLRRLVAMARRKGVPADEAAGAEAAIEEFDLLIRRDAGTRAALDALLSASLPDARERFELASKYSVYKGMSQLKGVQAEHWLGTAVVWPSTADATRLDLAWLNGAVAMQRLRPGVTARFSYRSRIGGQPGADDADAGIETLDQFCTNPPAQLQATRAGNAIHYTLPDDLLGAQEVVDMFVVDHHPAAVRRYATGALRDRIAMVLEPAFPVVNLVFDVLLRDDVFPGAEPELVLFDTGYDGLANVNDQSRDIDRVDLAESLEVLGPDMGAITADEIPRYGEMLAHLAARFELQPARFRGYRTRIRYPVYGWQISMSFDPPAA